MQSGGYICHRAVLQIFGFDLRYGVGYVAFLDGTVTDSHYFLQGGNILLHTHLHLTILDISSDRFVAHVTDIHFFHIVGHSQFKMTVYIRNGTNSCSLRQYAGADKRLALHIQDGT